MSRVLRFGQFAVGLAFIFGIFTVTESMAQGPLGQILKRLDDNNKLLTSLRADVTMVKTDSVLKVSDTSMGGTSYLPKTPKRATRYIRIDWTKPVEEQILVIGDKYELYRPRLNQVIHGTAGKSKNSSSVGGALAFMSMSREQLQQNYKTVYIGEEIISGGVKTWHLEMTPLSATSYKTAEIWIDGNGMPRQAKIVEQNNDSTTVLLTNIQQNVTIKADIFRLNYPGTVKKIKA